VGLIGAYLPSGGKRPNILQANISADVTLRSAAVY
jgi:hypothetical protein